MNTSSCSSTGEIEIMMSCETAGPYSAADV